MRCNILEPNTLLLNELAADYCFYLLAMLFLIVLLFLAHFHDYESSLCLLHDACVSIRTVLRRNLWLSAESVTRHYILLIYYLYNIYLLFKYWSTIILFPRRIGGLWLCCRHIKNHIYLSKVTKQYGFILWTHFTNTEVLYSYLTSRSIVLLLDAIWTSTGFFPECFTIFLPHTTTSQRLERLAAVATLGLLLFAHPSCANQNWWHASNIRQLVSVFEILSRDRVRVLY